MNILGRGSWLRVGFCLMLMASGVAEDAAFAARADEVATKPEPLQNPGEWFSADDYPVAASLDGLEGRTGFRLDIDTDGRVTGCAVTMGSGLELLDETACTILRQRARFKPAMNRKKAPVVGHYTGTVNWRMPEAHAIRIAEYPKRLRLSYDVDESGAVTACTVAENVGDATYVEKLGRSVDPCEMMKKSKYLTPTVDAQGEAIAVHVETISETKITPR